MRTKYTGIVTYKSVHNAIVSQVDERQVLGYNGKERNLKHKEILLTYGGPQVHTKFKSLTPNSNHSH